MSKVSLLDLIRLTDVCRFRFDAATSTLGSNDPIGTYGEVSAWLGSLSTSQVSRLVFLRCFVTDPLDLGLYRCDLDAATLMAGSMDSVSTFWKVSGWLHNVAMSQVSHFMLLRLIHADVLNLELYRYDLDSIPSTPESNDSIGTFRVDYRWLRCAGVSAVSRFVFSHCIDLYRCELDSSALTAGPDESIRTICMADG